MNQSAQANPIAEPSRNFREATQDRLARERGAPMPTPVRSEPAAASTEDNADTTDPSLQEDEQGLHQPDVGREAADEGMVNELADDDSESQEPPEGSADYWKVQAARAEEARSNMERDYRRKTHKIAEAVRATQEQHDVVLAQAQFYAGLAEQGVRQFDSVNWQELQQRPEHYQQARQAFQVAQRYHEQLQASLQSVQKTAQEQRETFKKREAEVSREVLRSTIPNWSNQLYSDLRAFAVEELDYAPAEFDEITDWRRIRDVHSQWSTKKAREVLNKPPKRNTQPERRSSANAPLSVARGDRGQFQSARQALLSRPGDRSARSNFFQAKLKAERSKPSD